MGVFLTLMENGSFIMEYFIACVLFLLPLNRKRRMTVRLLVGLGIEICVNWLIFLIINAGLIHISFAFMTAFVLACGLFLFCAEITLEDAVFGATCAYAVQHLSYVIHSFFETLYPMGRLISDVTGALIFFVTATVCYFIFARKLPISGNFGVGWVEAIRAMVMVLPYAFFLSMIAEQNLKADADGSVALFLICRVYAAICCVFVLWIQTSTNEKVAVQIELNTQEMLWQQQKEQYKISRENIDLINEKCHDLKHQIIALRNAGSEGKKNQYLDEIEESVMIYDCGVKTGNEVLDTILTERSLSCKKENISWTCMADAEKLDFMDPVDLYALFGNALDNAIESVRNIKDTEKRVVAVTLYTKTNMIILQIENYYAGEIQFRDGLPITSKHHEKGYHGFGVKSLKRTAEKYGGSLSINAADHIFLLSIVIPVP